MYNIGDMFVNYSNPNWYTRQESFGYSLANVKGDRNTIRLKAPIHTTNEAVDLDLKHNGMSAMGRRFCI